MFAKSRRVVLLVLILFLFSVLVVSAENEKKPGFHGWGDSQEATSEKKPDEARSEKLKEEAPLQKKEARKAETGKPKADKPRTADSKPKDPVREKIRKERKAFFEDTKSLRQDIHQKRLELRSELAKKKPSARRAKAIQKDILKLRTKMDQKRLEHFLELKKIDPELGWRGFRGKGGYGGCQDCPYQGRGYGRGHHMMGPGYGRHHMWNEDEDRQPRRKNGDSGWQKKKSSLNAPGKQEYLSESDAVDIVGDFLMSARDLNLQIGGISDAGDAYLVDILTRSGSVFDRVLVDKKNGHMRPVP